MLRRWPFFKMNDVPVLGAISTVPSSQVRQSSDMMAGWERCRWVAGFDCSCQVIGVVKLRLEVLESLEFVCAAEK